MPKPAWLLCVDCERDMFKKVDIFVSKRSTSLFFKSSCDSQKLRYFTLSPEHKGRVLVQEFQYLRF